jgi:ATP-dependent DNA helicase RecG
MLTFDELWERLNACDESVEIEAKHGSEIGDSALETVSAFSNEPHRGGGYFLFGVRQKPDSLVPDYELVGVPAPDRLVNELAARCNTEFNHPVRSQIATEQREGKNAVVAFVPEAPPHHKPIFLKKRGAQRGAYRRIGSADVLCSEEDIALFYQEQSHRTFDATLVEEATIEDLDPDMLREYRRLRAQVNPNAAELAMSDEDLLYALHAATRHGRRLVPTVGGILLVGTRAAVRRYFPAMRVDYVRVPGREWVSDPDRRYEAVEILDPLLRAIPRAIGSVMDDLPKAFHLPPGEDRRQEIPRLPYRVVREVIVNAVMHRSYRLDGPILIIRYANRIEVRNPGMSLVPDDRLGEPGSITRNARIAAVLHETQYAEAKGTGIRTVRELMKQHDLAPPFFESDRERDSFTAYLLFHHLLNPEDIEWLAGFRQLGLSTEEQKALVYVREVGAIDNALYRMINGVETLVASHHLQRLRDVGLLLPKGQGRATYYVPAPALTQSVAGPGSALRAMTEGSEHMPDALSTMPEPLSDMAGRERPMLQELPGPLRAAAAELGQRAPRDRVRGVILALCALRPMQAEEIATVLRRQTRPLQKQYLGPMVADGLLEHVYPEYPKHPRQAYSTTIRP